MAKEGFLCAAVEETKYLIKKQRAEVRDEKKQGVEFPGHKKVKAGIQRYLAMLLHNQMSGYLPCQNGTTNNPQTRWRRKGTCAPPPDRRRQQTPEPTPPVPGTPPAPTSNPSVVQRSQIINFRPNILIHIQLFLVQNFPLWWGYPAQYRFWSRYADWWKNIHWLVPYLWCGNAANIHFGDQSSGLSDPGTDDELWLKDMGFWRLSLYLSMYY